MADKRTENLAELQKQEAKLLAELEEVRLAIQILLKKLPAEARGGTKLKPAEPADTAGDFMNEVLAELGIRFTSVDIFEKAKQMHPGFDRVLLEKGMNRLQRAGSIRKIEAGRGWRPARYQKTFRD